MIMITLTLASIAASLLVFFGYSLFLIKQPSAYELIEIDSCYTRESLFTNTGYKFELELETNVGQLYSVVAYINPDESPIPFIFHEGKQLHLATKDLLFIASALHFNIECLEERAAEYYSSLQFS